MPSISLCMIVKNEEEYLANCLSSVAGAVDEIVVIDTGSTDRTIEIAMQFGARVQSMEWQGDFAAARNMSLDLATKEYVLVLDADEELLPESCEALRRCLQECPEADGFFVRMLNQTDADGYEDMEVSLNVRVFRNDPRYRYSGALHEQIAEAILHGSTPGKIYDSDIKILHFGYMQQAVAKQQKKQRNLEIALKECDNYPEDAFRVFNLGVEYVRLKDWPKAIETFAKARNLCDKSALWVSRLYKIYLSTLAQNGDWETAASVLTEALVLFPGYTDLIYFQGVIHIQMKEWDQALKNFAKCIEMGDPPCPPYTIDKGISNFRSYYAMAQAFEAIGRTADAATAYREAFQINPHLSESYLRFAALLLREAADKETLSYLYQIAAVTGEDGIAHVGMALTRVSRFVDAKKWLEAAQDQSKVVDELALTYACLDDRSELWKLLKKYDPDGKRKAKLGRKLLSGGLQVLEEGLRRFPESQSLQRLKAEYAGLDL